MARPWGKVYASLLTHPKYLRATVNQRAAWQTLFLASLNATRDFDLGPRDDVLATLASLGHADPDTDLAALLDLRLVDVGADGHHYLHDWDDWQPADPTGARRKAEERERKRAETVSRDSHRTPDDPPSEHLSRDSHATSEPDAARSTLSDRVSRDSPVTYRASAIARDGDGDGELFLEEGRRPLDGAGRSDSRRPSATKSPTVPVAVVDRPSTDVNPEHNRDDDRGEPQTEVEPSVADPDVDYVAIARQVFGDDLVEPRPIAPGTREIWLTIDPAKVPTTAELASSTATVYCLDYAAHQTTHHRAPADWPDAFACPTCGRRPE